MFELYEVWRSSSALYPKTITAIFVLGYLVLLFGVLTYNGIKVVKYFKKKKQKKKRGVLKYRY